MRRWLTISLLYMSCGDGPQRSQPVPAATHLWRGEDMMTGLGAVLRATAPGAGANAYGYPSDSYLLELEAGIDEEQPSFTWIPDRTRGERYAIFARLSEQDIKQGRAELKLVANESYQNLSTGNAIVISEHVRPGTVQSATGTRQAMSGTLSLQISSIDGGGITGRVRAIPSELSARFETRGGVSCLVPAEQLGGQKQEQPVIDSDLATSFCAATSGWDQPSRNTQ